MNVELHPFSRSDIKELMSWIRNPEELFLWSADTFTFPLDEEQLENHFQKGQESETRSMYTAIDGNTKERIGHIELTRIDREKGKASIAYILVDPERRSLGYGAGMIQAILKECFQHMKMTKVDLFVFEFNAVAINMYQKHGFELEEVIKDRIKLNDTFATLYLMGLSYDRWIAHPWTANNR